MKKYLMTGVAALAICAAFTSCSKSGDELYNPDAVSQMNKEKITETYNARFIAYVGGPIAPDQDWGFGTAGTRAHANGAIDVNGNEWTSCPAVDTPTEVNAIYEYVHHTLAEMDDLGYHYSTTAPQNINGYYVTQVRNGLNDDNNYPAFDGTSLEHVGAKMNFLQIKFDKDAGFPVNQGQNAGWEHINNFNGSTNANWSNDQSPLHGNTKVVDRGAYDFAYYSSLDSKFHNNWILVDGYYITEDHKYKDFYYVCFDFEGTPECVTKFRFKYNGQEYGDVRVDAVVRYSVTQASV